jgi:intracellular multiplication protein IcmV
MVGILSGIARIGKSFFDIKTWTDSRRVIDAGKMIWEGAHQVVAPQNTSDNETFEKARSRLQLNEDDLRRLAGRYLLTAFIFIVLALAAVGYTVYMLMQGATHSCLIGLVAVALASAQFFRYHFWYFQIKQQKLGCTFQEWLHQGILRRKK